MSDEEPKKSALNGVSSGHWLSKAAMQSFAKPIVPFAQYSGKLISKESCGLKSEIRIFPSLCA